MTVLVGMQMHAAVGAAASRQERACRELTALSGIERVNLQFARDSMPFAREGFDTLRVLEQDSLTVTASGPGPRKPVISELCTTLAREARRRGCEYFCFANSDVLFTQAAIDEMEERQRTGYALSRTDVDPATGADLRIAFEGVDVFAARATWWLGNLHRFRPFIVGEPCWDSQYACTLVRNSDAVILNTRPLIRHVFHTRAWSPAGPFARYNGYLTALDARLFSLWCEYHALRASLGSGELTDADERRNLAQQDAVIRRPWPRGSGLMQAARSAKAWARYAVDRRRMAAR